MDRIPMDVKEKRKTQTGLYFLQLRKSVAEEKASVRCNCLSEFVSGRVEEEVECHSACKSVSKMEFDIMIEEINGPEGSFFPIVQRLDAQENPRSAIVFHGFNSYMNGQLEMLLVSA